MDIGSAVSRTHWSDDQIRAVQAGRDEGFSDVERLVLRFADAVTATPVDVSDELFAALRRHFSEEQLIELSAVIAHENFRARMYHALGIESDKLYCELPQQAPAAD
jgi:alkylhydroperoxidase family enzyme